MQSNYKFKWIETIPDTLMLLDFQIKDKKVLSFGIKFDSMIYERPDETQNKKTILTVFQRQYINSDHFYNIYFNDSHSSFFVDC
jgi:hypothetical protein